MKIFYFSATGNSLALAKRIGGSLISIPQIMEPEYRSYKDDVIGIVFPIYGLKAPKIVRRFLATTRFDAEYLFAIGTYGNMPGAAMLNLQKLAKKRGYSFDYTTSILMVDNFLPVFEMENEISKIPEKGIDEAIAKIIEDIKSGKRMQSTASLGMRALTTGYGYIEKLILNGKHARSYIVGDTCIKCGICAQVCPAGNVAVGEKVEFADRCEWCQACVHLCPQNAIHVKNEKSAKRWRNPEVTLKEIIDGNSQLERLQD